MSTFLCPIAINREKKRQLYDETCYWYCDSPFFSEAQIIDHFKEVLYDINEYLHEKFDCMIAKAYTAEVFCEDYSSSIQDIKDIKDENVNLINVNVDVITTFQTFCFVTFKIDLLLEFEVVERGEPVKVWNTKEMI